MKHAQPTGAPLQAASQATCWKWSRCYGNAVSFYLMKEYSSLWYCRHSKAFPRFQTKRYASGNDLFLFSVFCRIPEKTGNTGAEKLRGRAPPMTHGVYLLYRLFKDSSTKSYGEEKPNRYSTNNKTSSRLMLHKSDLQAPYPA